MTAPEGSPGAGSSEVLQSLVGRFGPAILNERRRALGTLADRMPDRRREMHLLAAAFDEGVPSRLASGAAAPADVEREIRRLSDSRGLSPDLARWTVSVLAQALAGQTSSSPPTEPVPAMPEANAPLAAPIQAAPTHKHQRFWRFVRIGVPIIVAIFGVLRFLASLPSP